MQSSGQIGILIVVAAVVVGLLAYRMIRSQRAPAPADPLAAASDGADLSTSAARLLAERFGGAAGVDRGALRIANRTLKIRAALDYVTSKDGKVIVGLDVKCDVDGVTADALHSGSIGIDETPEAAVRTAIEEWVGQYGIPIATALQEQAAQQPSGLQVDAGENQKWGFPAGQFVVYPGPVGIRGAEVSAEMKTILSGADLHRRFFRELESSLPDLIPSGAAGLHAFTLTLVLRNGAPTTGECRVDGQVSERLCDLARAFAWPKPVTTYMLKQYYVLSAPSEPQRPSLGTHSP